MQNIKKDYLWNSLGSLLQSAISPVLLIIITRLNGIDDSGLFIDALDGAPGVHSARWTGIHRDYDTQNAKVLDLMKGETNRSAC